MCAAKVDTMTVATPFYTTSNVQHGKQSNRYAGVFVPLVSHQHNRKRLAKVGAVTARAYHSTTRHLEFYRIPTGTTTACFVVSPNAGIYEHDHTDLDSADLVSWCMLQQQRFQSDAFSG